MSIAFWPDTSCDEVFQIRVVGAQLSRSFAPFGQMDPFTEIGHLVAGERVAIAVTRADRQGHLAPVWNYTSLGQPYSAQASGVVVSEEALEFRVMDGSSLFGPVLCGVAQRPLRELVDAGEAQQLALLKAGEETGTITVHVSLARVGEDQQGPRTEADLTHADPALFETPVARLPVSGGTAPFFQLRLRAAGRSPTYYIGKDLAHTQDEVQFYEDVLAISGRPADEQEGFGGLLDFMFEYLGILQAQEEGSAQDAEPRKMLVLRNLFDGCTALRMLDVKIGQKTAAAGHHGKSRFKAWMRGIIDPLTNSGSQGFRLAGFNGQPLSYTSRDPIVEAEALGVGREDFRKKAGRMMLSQVRGDEMFLYFLDTHQLARTATGAPGELAPSELMELVLHEVVAKLVALAAACRRVVVPQKWIGSSVGLAFDCGQLPCQTPGTTRGQLEDQVRQSVRVHAFDWGRSDLSTVAQHRGLSEQEKLECSEYWGYYVGGVDRLAWEAARTYLHRFGNSAAWATLRVEVMDYKSVLPDTELGGAELPLKPTDGPQEVALTCRGAMLSATLTYSVELCDVPSDSRLHSIWRITVHRAAKLPKHDLHSGKSDPYVVVTATSADGRLSFRQHGRVIPTCLEPEWEDVFEVALAREAGRLGRALGPASPAAAPAVLGADGPLAPPPVSSAAEEEDAAVAQWVKWLNETAGGAPMDTARIEGRGAAPQEAGGAAVRRGLSGLAGLGGRAMRGLGWAVGAERWGRARRPVG